MRIEKDDRYVSEPPKKNSASLLKSPTLQGLSKPKLVVIALIVLIILIILGLIIFSSHNKKSATSPLPNTTSNEQVTNTAQSENGNGLLAQQSDSSNVNPDGSQNTTANNSSDSSNNTLSSADNGKVIAPQPISRTATETQYQKSQMQERLEIPDEVTQQLSQNAASAVVTEVKPKVVSHPATTKPKTVHNATIPLNKVSDNHFSIQLNASTSAESLKAFVKKNQITNYQIYETKRNNKPWFVLVKGSYASSKEAKEAINALPSELQKNKPWIKSGATINKEKAAK